jgi:hypothetical protein
MPPRRASKRARPADDPCEEAQDELAQEQEQQQQQQQQQQRRAPRPRRAAARAADANADDANAANAADEDAATERESDPTAFQGLTDEEEGEEAGTGAVEQPPRRRQRTLQQQPRRRRPAALIPPPPPPRASSLPPPPPPRPAATATTTTADARKLSPLALTLYVRWWAPDGLKTRVHEIPLRSLGSADDLQGLPRELVRRLFSVPASLPADASIAQHLPPHAAGPDFYRFTPAGGRDFLSVPGPIAAFEVRLVVAAGGWEHTIADRGGGGLGGPGDVVVAVTEFESPPVDLGPGAFPPGFPRALLPMLRLPLIAYPLVCVRRSFLDRVERMLTGADGAGAGMAGGGAMGWQQQQQRGAVVGMGANAEDEQEEAAPGAAAAVASGAWQGWQSQRQRPPPTLRIVPGAQPPLPGADHPGAGAAGVGGAVAFCAESVATFDGRCAAGVAASLGRPDGGRVLGNDAAVAMRRAAAVRPIVPL